MPLRSLLSRALRVVAIAVLSLCCGAVVHSAAQPIQKRVLINGVDIGVSVVDRGHGLAVDIDIANGSPADLQIDPARVELQAVRPHQRSLAQMHARALADRVRREADQDASAAEARGALAMTTVVETVPVTEIVPNPAAAADPTQPPTMVTMSTKTEVKVVPDTLEQMRAMGEGATIRQRGNREAREIEARSLVAGSVAPGGRRAGVVHFQRDASLDEIVVRVAVGQAIGEVPFTVTARRGFFGPSRLIFQ